MNALLARLEPHRALPVLVVMLCVLCPGIFASGGNCKNFDVAVYPRVYEVRQMKDPAYLENTWTAISRHVKVDKMVFDTFCRPGTYSVFGVVE